MMKGTWLRILLLLVFVGGLAAAGGWWMLRGQVESVPISDKDTKDEVQVEEVSNPANITINNVDTLNLPSIIEPFESVPVSSRLTANIIRLLVRDGGTVKEGQLLCILDDTEIRREVDAKRLNLLREEEALRSILKNSDISSKSKRIALTRAEQDLSAAKARNALELQKAQDILLRTQRELLDCDTLYKAKAVSADDVRKRREAVKDAEQELNLLSTSQAASIAALEKAVEQAKLDIQNEATSAQDIRPYRLAVSNAQGELAETRRHLSDTRVLSPIGGVVRVVPRTRSSSMTFTGQSAEKLGPGVRVYEGDPFLEIATNQACCRIEVDETDIVRLHTGMGAKITGDAIVNQELRGKIVTIQTTGRKAAEGISLFPVTILITSPLQDMRMGMTADVTIDLTQRPAIGGKQP